MSDDSEARFESVERRLRVQRCLTTSMAVAFAGLVLAGCWSRPEVYMLGMITTRDLDLPHRTLSSRVTAFDCGEENREMGDLGTAVAFALSQEPGATHIENAKVGTFARDPLSVTPPICVRVTGEAVAFE